LARFDVGLVLTVITYESIKHSLPKIFQKGTYALSSVEAASYNLRVDDSELIIDGVLYHEKNPYPYEKNNGCIVIPKRKISVLTSIEIFQMPANMVARGGLSLGFTSRGVIPLFGAQVDPHFTGKYIAILWNASNQDIQLHKGDHLIKLEFHKTDKAFPKRRAPKSIFDIDPFLTKDSLLHDLDQRLGSIEGNISKLDSQLDKLGESTSGYRTIVLFAIFLVASAVLGSVLNELLSSSRILARELTGDQLTFLAVAISLVIPIIAVITLYMIVRGRPEEKDRIISTREHDYEPA